LSFCDHRVVEAAADQALDREEGVLGLVTAWRLAGWPTRRSPFFGEGDHGGGGARALGVLDDPGVLAFHDGDAGIGRAEVDADDFVTIQVNATDKSAPFSFEACSALLGL
jgi:hypothetical protein